MTIVGPFVSWPLIGYLSAANMNSTADQAFAFPIAEARYLIRRITCANASANLTGAIGGIYPAASKGGTPIVAATQIYSGLTGSTLYVDLTLAAAILTTIQTSNTLFLSLTSALGSAGTADFYIFGDRLP